MKAAQFPRYGLPEVLRVVQVDRPQPMSHEVLIEVKASSVTTADTMLRRGDPYVARFATGFPKPKVKITGTGYAGKVVAVGESVKQFNVGDDVFGETALGFSANAEYVCVPADGLILPLPSKQTYEEAAPLGDGALTALNFLRCITTVSQGQRILINGASGSIGTAAIQIAKYFGAHVTAVCSTKNHTLVTSLGADDVLDYQHQDFADTKIPFDIIFDTVGKRTYGSCKHALTAAGTFISPVLSLSLLGQMLCTHFFTKRKAKFSATGLKSTDELLILMRQVVDMIEAGKLKTVIDRAYPLDEIVEAHKYVETGHKAGSVVTVSL